MRSLSIVTLMLLVMSPYFLKAQDSLGLKECIQRAWDYNIDIHQTRLEYESGKADILSSKGAYLPTISFGADQRFNWGRTIDPFTNLFTTNLVRSNNIGLQGSWLLFGGLQNHHNLQQNRSLQEAREEDIRRLKVEVANRVGAAYLQWALAERQQQIYLAQMATTRENLSRVRKLVNGGKSLEADYQILEGDLHTLEAQYLESENQILIAKMELATLLQLEDPESLNLRWEVTEAYSDTTALPPPGSLFESSREGYPTLRAARLREAASRSALSSSNGRYLPRLSLNANISTLYSSNGSEVIGTTINGTRYIGSTTSNDSVFSPNVDVLTQPKSFGDQWQDNINRSISLNLTIPILNGFQTRTAVQRARIQVESSKWNTVLAENLLRQDIYNAWGQARLASRRWSAWQKVRLAREAVAKQGALRMEAGRITAFELAQVNNQLVEASEQEAQAHFEYIYRALLLSWYDLENLPN
jgi:outer membrane protein